MLKTRADLDALRAQYSAAAAAEEKKILVCAGTGCVSSGSLDIFDRLRQLMQQIGRAHV